MSGFERAYAQAFERYAAAPGEGALAEAYELGRSAVRQGLSVLDLATAHHDALASATASRADGEVTALMGAAGEFFLEAVCAFEMRQRVLLQERQAAAVERRHAAVLRQLSSFLGDASIALDASSSLAEMLQLVAEHAREVIGGDRCLARLDMDSVQLEAEACADTARPVDGRETLVTPLTALDGSGIGEIEVFAAPGGEFTELDEAVLVQLAQMASAAVERAQLYRS